MSSADDLKSKEEKDAELDRRIEALRKKNEALVKRYQEIEEDKKKAEQEGIAVTTPRKPRPHEPETDRRKSEKENFTVTVDLSKPAGEKRVINDWKPGTPRGRKLSEESDGQKAPADGHSPTRRTGSGRISWGGARGGGGGRQERRDREPRTPRGGDPGESGGQGRRGGRRGRGGDVGGGGTPGGMDRKSKEWEEKRRQNIEKMNEEMERIAEYERGQREGDKPIRNFLDDPRRSGPAPDTDRKEGSRRHVRNWGGLDFDNVKTGTELEKEWTSRRPGPKGSVDMTMSMTGRERAEYLRWKKEREQIDEERLARHRNATGQWRREWDAQKTESMFKEDTCVGVEGVTPEQGSRRARGRNPRTEPRGRASDDSKRPPKAPTFGDFLSQGRGQGPRGDRSRGRGRGQKQSYSMHDNRWEGEKEEEKEEKEKEKEDKMKKEKTKKNEEEKEKPKPSQKVEENNGDEADDDDDDDDWEDASDGEDVEEKSGSEDSSRASEKKDSGKEKRVKSKDSSPASPTPRPRPTSAGSPREQRTPRPKVHIPPPAAAQESPEGGKPISPFSPLDGHRPVSDWGEEMEMLSPRSSMGGESPQKPPSAEASPPQKKEQELKKEQEQVAETEIQPSSSSEPAEPQKDEDTVVDTSSPPEETETQETLVESELKPVPTDSVTATPSDATPSDAYAKLSDGTPSDAMPSVATPPVADAKLSDGTPSDAMPSVATPPVADAKLSDATPSDSDATPSDATPPAPADVTEAPVITDQDTPVEPDAAPPPAVLETDESCSDPAGDKDEDRASIGTSAASTEETAESSEQMSSG